MELSLVSEVYNYYPRCLSTGWWIVSHWGNLNFSKSGVLKVVIRTEGKRCGHGVMFVNWLGRWVGAKGGNHLWAYVGQAVEFEGRRKCLTFSVLGLVFIGWVVVIGFVVVVVFLLLLSCCVPFVSLMANHLSKKKAWQLVIINRQQVGPYSVGRKWFILGSK